MNWFIIFTAVLLTVTVAPWHVRRQLDIMASALYHGNTITLAPYIALSGASQPSLLWHTSNNSLWRPMRQSGGKQTKGRLNKQKIKWKNEKWGDENCQCLVTHLGSGRGWTCGHISSAACPAPSGGSPPLRGRCCCCWWHSWIIRIRTDSC